MADLTRLAHRLNNIRSEQESIALRLLHGTRELSGQQVHELKLRYSFLAVQAKRLTRRLP